MRPPRRGPARELALGRRTAHVTIRPRLGRLRLLCHGCHERAAGRPTCSSRSRPPIKGPAAIAACLAGGDQHQRHVDLLAVPLRRRHGRIPRRHGTGTHEAAELRGRRAIANAQLAYQDYERCSPPRGGPGCRRPEPGRNGRCGRRRRPRTRPIPHPLGHAWAWTSGQPRAPVVSPGHLNPVVYVAKCWVPAVPIDWFFPDAEAVIGVRLGITVETTENQGGWEPSCVSRATLGPRWGPCHNGRAWAWAVTYGRPRFGGTAGSGPFGSSSWANIDKRFTLWSRRSSTVAVYSPVNGLGSSTVNVATPAP
jgi:hypothetical protein